MSDVAIAQLTNLGKDNVFTEEADVGYECLASCSDGSALEYKWTIHGQSFTSDSAVGTARIKNLESGKKNEISGSVTVICNPSTQEAGVEDTPTIETTGSNSVSLSPISVYTRPGAFADYTFAAGTTIESAAGLTAAKVGNWIAHCNAFNNWFNQPSSPDDESDVGPSCSVSQGDYITASWYNECVNAIADQSKRPNTVTGGSTGTIINTSVFKALGDAISITDNPVL